MMNLKMMEKVIKQIFYFSLLLEGEFDEDAELDEDDEEFDEDEDEEEDEAPKSGKKQRKE